VKYMKRRKFLGTAGGSVLLTEGIYYLLSDKRYFVRDDIKTCTSPKSPLQQDKRQIMPRFPGAARSQYTALDCKINKPGIETRF